MVNMHHVQYQAVRGVAAAIPNPDIPRHCDRNPILGLACNTTEATTEIAEVDLTDLTETLRHKQASKRREGLNPAEDHLKSLLLFHLRGCWPGSLEMSS